MADPTESKPKVKALRYDIGDGYDVWRWPEFQALLKRLGVDLEAPTTCITIKIPGDDIVKITHEYNGLDMTQERK